MRSVLTPCVPALPLTVLAVIMLAATVPAALVGAAQAQTAPYPAPGYAQNAYAQNAYGQNAYGQNAYRPGYGVSIGDRQRYEMEQVQARSAEAENLARLQSLETRLTLQELQARRDAAGPLLANDAAHLPPYTLEQARRAREAATTQRQTTVDGVTQIDAWLDRTRPQ